MSELSAFFRENIEAAAEVEYIATQRVKVNGDPVKWRLRPISSDDDARIRKACTKRVPVPGRKGAYSNETDTYAYLDQLVLATVAFPNLNDVQLQNSYGVMGGVELVKQILSLPGEYTSLVAKVQEVNGFDLSFEEQVEEAKN